MAWRPKPRGGVGATAGGGLSGWSARFRALAAACRDPRLRAYYERPPVAADTPIQEVPLLALDLETTGLNADMDSIVSIGLIPLVGGRIRCRGARNWLIRPHRPLSETTIQFHGITHSDLAAAPSFAERLADLLTRMADRVVVVHCLEIERQFLDAAVRRVTGETFTFPMIDTMLLEARTHPPGPLVRLLRRLGGRAGHAPSLRLDACRRRYGLPRYRPHHALTDALATAELFEAQRQHHYSAHTPVSALWS